MGKIFHITEDYSERGGYGQRGDHEEMLERAFKEGCEHGYKKAMRDLEGYGERGRMGRISHRHYKEGFEEKLEKLKESNSADESDADTDDAETLGQTSFFGKKTNPYSD